MSRSSIISAGLCIKMAMAVGAIAIVGHMVMPSIGVIGAIAFMAIAALITYPYLCSFLVGFSGASGAAGYQLSENASTCCAWISKEAFFLAAIAAAHAICSLMPELSSFSLGEAYEFYGYFYLIEVGMNCGLVYLGSSFAGSHGLANRGIAPGVRPRVQGRGGSPPPSPPTPQNASVNDPSGGPLLASSAQSLLGKMLASETFPS